jgi:hypothetical protein
LAWAVVSETAWGTASASEKEWGSAWAAAWETAWAMASE